MGGEKKNKKKIQDQDVNNRFRRMSHKIAEHGRKLRRSFRERQRGGKACLLDSPHIVYMHPLSTK